MRLFLSLFMAYLIGSIPPGYLIAKITKGVDIRKYGSGNIGATNVLRVMGKLAALITLLIDIFKGFFVVTFFADMMYTFRFNLDYTKFVAILAVCVVAGHMYSLFLDFKGGKGVATSAGVLLAVCPKLLLIGLCIWAAVFLMFRIVSISSLISSFSIIVASYFFAYPRTIRLLVLIIGILIIIKHKDNLRRIARKEEHRWSVRI